MNADDIIIKRVKLSGEVKIKYQAFNGSIEQYEDVDKGFKENPHPDFHETLDTIAQQAMQEAGFPASHPSWGKYKIATVKFDGVQIQCDIVFNHATLGDPISISIPKTNAVEISVIEDFLIEAKEFVLGKKKQQGDLFEQDIPKAEVVDENAQLPEGEEQEGGLVKA